MVLCYLKQVRTWRCGYLLLVMSEIFFILYRIDEICVPMINHNRAYPSFECCCNQYYFSCSRVMGLFRRFTVKGGLSQGFWICIVTSSSTLMYQYQYHAYVSVSIASTSSMCMYQYREYPDVPVSICLYLLPVYWQYQFLMYVSVSMYQYLFITSTLSNKEVSCVSRKCLMFQYCHSNRRLCDDRLETCYIMLIYCFG